MTKPNAAASFENQRRAVIVKWLLFALLAISLGYDAFYIVTDPVTAARLAPIMATRAVLLVGMMFLNWRGWSRTVAAATLALVPLMISVRLLSATAPEPLRLLHFLLLDVVGASILFGARTTIAFALVNLVVLAVVGGGVLGLNAQNLAASALMSLVTAGLLIAGIRHRQDVERAGRDEVLANEARKTAMLESALDSIVSIDGHGHIIEFNPAAERTFQRRRQDVIGRELATVIVPERDRAAHRTGMQRYQATRASRILGRRVELTALRGDGTEFPCEAAIVASGDDDQLLFTAYLRDLTERNEALARHASLEQQLRDSQKMQAVGQLAGGVAHDFNNTLQAVGGYLSFALEDARRIAPTLAADLEAAEQATQRAAGFVRQLLTFSRRQPVDLRPTALDDVVAGFLPLVKRTMTERIEVQFHPGGRLPLVRLDQGQIQQVVLNLCLNARDAMPDGGRLSLEIEAVTITAEFAAANPWARAGGYGVLTITDSGVGMTPEVRQRMFEPFFSTKGTERGTGLGLAVVYGIVEQHRGFIQVNSGHGQGTAIRIYLPVSGEAPAHEANGAPDTVPGGTKHCCWPTTPTRCAT